MILFPEAWREKHMEYKFHLLFHTSYLYMDRCYSHDYESSRKLFIWRCRCRKCDECLWCVFSFLISSTFIHFNIFVAATKPWELYILNPVSNIITQPTQPLNTICEIWSMHIYKYVSHICCSLFYFLQKPANQLQSYLSISVESKYI